MNSSSTLSCFCEEVEADEEPPPQIWSKQVLAQEVEELVANRPVTQVAAEIAALPPKQQLSAFYQLSKTEASSVYQCLDSSIREHLVENFKHQNGIDLVAELSLEERIQLFELLYKPSTSGKKARKDSGAESKDDTSKNPLGIVRQRLVWLLVLLVANTSSAAVISSQEDILEQVVVLASFIPLLIASAGNVSTQAATVVVRSLCSGQTNLSDLWKVLCREMIAGLVLGAVLGMLVAGIALLLQASQVVALVVGLSLLVISVVATLCGVMLPFCFQLLGFDPALMSAPFSATLVDIAGILIYLGVARLILHI